jgi:hypothetical protein
MLLMKLEKEDLTPQDNIMLTIKSKGDWRRTTQFLDRAQKLKLNTILQKYGDIGVSALANATPKDTGLTASSWDYTIETTGKGYKLQWFNTNVNNSSVIALLIQYGHGTGTGGYIPPTDYINPAIKPIFEKITDNVLKEVSSL